MEAFTYEAHGRLYSSLNELTLVSSRSSSGSLSALDTSHNIVEDSANCMTVDVDVRLRVARKRMLLANTRRSGCFAIRALWVHLRFGFRLSRWRGRAHLRL